MKDYIEYNGNIYAFVKESKGQGYYRRTERLHRRVWEDNNGPVPKGMCIHHLDGNTRNNSIDNLQCLSIKDHHKIHFSSEKQVAHLHAAREKANLWHKSKKGRKKLSELGKKQWLTAKPLPFTCTICGYVGETMNRSGTKYCSQKCRSRAGYLALFVKKKCFVCDSEFQTADRKTRTCSPQCASELTAQTKKERKDGLVSSDRHHVLHG